MAPPKIRSRIHLIAAKTAPVLLVLQRKRAKLFHVITVGTDEHWINEGSWFRGVIYPIDSDVSFDGKFMVYRARGANNETWSGICRLPWLKTLLHVETPITGGGYFSAPHELKTHGWDRREKVVSSDVPFTITRDTKRHFGYELAVIYGRFERDGFVRLGDNWGEELTVREPRYQVTCVGDDGWGFRPARGYPELRVRYLGFFDSAFKFEFTLDEHPDLLKDASWATWDSRKSLWVARPGMVEQYTRDDLRRGAPSFTLDVDQFEPSPRADQETPLVK
jgi:hypothetical protein